MKHDLLDILNSRGLPNEMVDDTLDRYFEIGPAQIEAEFQQKNSATYAGHNLSPQALYTSYQDFYQIAKLIGGPNKTFVDLGSGVARSKLLFDGLQSFKQTWAIEYHPERLTPALASAKRLGLDTSGYIVADLETTAIPAADYYFVYLPTGRVLDRALEKIRSHSQQNTLRVIVIESHGDLIPAIKRDSPWLMQKRSWPLFSQRHYPEAILFESTPSNDRSRHSQIKALTSDREHALEITDQDVGSSMVYTWLAPTYNLLNDIKDDHYLVDTPKRVIASNQIRRIITCPEPLKKWFHLCQSQENYKNLGRIQKIIISPKIYLEFSKAGRLALTDNRLL